MPDQEVLRSESLTIGYRRARRAAAVVASGLSFALRPGQLVCLLGPNGAGKSTLMRTLARLQPALSGRIWLDGRPLAELRPGQLARRLSVVLTDQVDVGALTGFGLASLGRHPYTGWTGSLDERDERIVHWALHAVRAAELAPRPIGEMSDGERQKIMIARALAQEPRLMLLDEPTAFLDLPRRVEMMHLLRRLARENGQAILLSTHDLDLALRNADRLWLLSADGALYQGAPEDLVLSGAFERVFSAEGVSFDRNHGSFHTREQSCGLVLLKGEGPFAFWARRALERVGYAVEEFEQAAQTGGPPLNGAAAPSRSTLQDSQGGVRPGLRQPDGDGAGAVADAPAPRQPIGTVSVRLLDDGPTYLLKTAGSEKTFATLDGLTAHVRRGVAGGERDAKTDEDLHARR